jgi:hypothetical protein
LRTDMQGLDFGGRVAGRHRGERHGVSSGRGFAEHLQFRAVRIPGNSPHPLYPQAHAAGFSVSPHQARSIRDGMRPFSADTLAHRILPRSPISYGRLQGSIRSGRAASVMKRHYDWLVVGAGFTGAVFAERMASQAGQRVLLIDCRKSLGGNAYDERDETGVLRHVHGPHLFHTNSRAVFEYLSRFTDWMPYQHRVQAMIAGRLVPLPFNFASGSLPKPAARGLHAALRTAARS